MPERVLQFGTGVLLRGLSDFLIDKANQKGVFNGSIVIVKSTGAVEKVFEMQDCYYTLRQRGIENGRVKESTNIITSVRRVLSAVEHWAEILHVAANPQLEIILSNTTEAGLVYQAERIFATPPLSFPAKLTAFLYERFCKFDGAIAQGVTIVPTELIVNNGILLKKYVLQHAQNNDLGQPFLDWLEAACDFCDSLVDKIVTGAPSAMEKEKCWAKWGYQDDLCIDAEHFTLWAIECNKRAEQRLNRALAGDESVLLSRDITPFREQKLRLLNGGHTISVALSYLTGLETVGEMMNDPHTGALVRQVILKEILPTVLPISNTAAAFAQSVLDRFCNPYIIHPLLNITFQNTAKMQMRNALTFKRYYEQTGDLPSFMCLGFAGYLLFAKAEKVENGQFWGKRKGIFYTIKDDKAAFLNEHWQKKGQHLTQMVESILKDERIFEKNAFDLPNFASQIAAYLQQLMEQGVAVALKNHLNDSLGFGTSSRGNLDGVDNHQKKN